MRILMIGKFPPIEGGVSAHTFWLARSLAGEGHSVRVVTNASEVEPTFAQFHYGQDHEWLEGCVGSGEFRVHQTTPLEPLSFIPFAQPHLTKLFGLSLSVVEEHDCDVVVGWYFEPYGMVAALVGKAIGRPFIMRHAGSDLGRLARHPELAAAYRWALEGAAGLVVTNERELENRFGPISRPRLRLARPRLPDVFSSSQERLDVRELLATSARWFSNCGLPEDLILEIGRINAKSLPDDVFTVGVYGKVGVTKGTFDLIEGLAQVSGTGAEFAFLTVSCGRRETLQRYYEAIVSSAALAERSWILPPIAPWRIPGFLRCCDAVCFLERDFPVPFHGPLIPREVLSSGACLVCSGEIARKPMYCENFVDDRNVVIIADPKDRDSFASRLVSLIRDRDRTRAIGRQGRQLARFSDDELYSFDVATKLFVAEIERLAAPSASKFLPSKQGIRKVHSARPATDSGR